MSAKRAWKPLAEASVNVPPLKKQKTAPETSQAEASTDGTDTRDMQSDQVAAHDLGRQSPPDLSRRETAEPPPPDPKRPFRRLYTKKTARIYFSKYRRDEWAQATNTEPATETASEAHHLETMQKRRECVICRLDFREGKRGGRQRPKITSSECTICSPPAALCRPESSTCFTRWHARNQE